MSEEAEATVERVAPTEPPHLPPRTPLRSRLFRGNDRAFRTTRQIPVLGVFGENGMGKTANMVRLSIPTILEGRPILSSTPIYDPRTGQPYANFELFTHWEQLFSFREGDFLMDEIGAIADSANDMPDEVREHIPQLRKVDVFTRYTAPRWGNANLRIRQITQGIAICRAYAKASDRVGRKRGEDVALPSMWSQNRLFSVRTISAIGREEFTTAQVKTEKAKALEWWWGPGSDVFKSYDTKYRVLKVHGKCAVHGSKKTCTCRDTEPEFA